jgi:hypothetical protein
MTTDTFTAGTEWRRGFTATLMLASLLGGTTLALCGQSLAYQMAGPALAAGTWILGWGVVPGRRPGRFPLVVLLAVVLMAIFVVHLIGSSPPFPLRLLQIATILCYGAVLLAMFISILHLAGSGKALLLSFSFALSLFLCEVIVPHLVLTTVRLVQAGGVPRWVGGAVPHPTIGFSNPPNSSAKTFYPDNPRGYFERADLIRESWRLETHEGSEAQLEHSADIPGLLLVNISRTAVQVPWHVQLQQRYLQLKAGEKYMLSFRARAARKRAISVAAGQDHAPWQGLGLYRELQISPQWEGFESTFVAMATDPNARIHFDIGASDAAVEIADVVLRHTASQDLLTPNLPQEFFVTYNFNALGCRGRNFEIPRPEKTFRILALGDSYTLGVGVHERDTFTARLERLLSNKTNQISGTSTYEVINGGVSGYSTKDERLSFELVYSMYSPQVVLLVMVFNDDVSGPDEVRLGYFTPIGKYEKLSNLWLLLQDFRLRRPPPDFSMSVNELLKLNDSCRRNGAKLGVVVFRNSMRFDAFNQLLKAVQEGTKGTGIPVLDLGPALLNAHAEKDLMVHQYDGHPNEIAHAIAADEIAHFLNTSGLLR